MKLKSHFILQNESLVSFHSDFMLILILSHFTSHSSVSFHSDFMSSQFHLISSHRNLILSHLISQKSDSVLFHFTKILILSHLISQRSHLILVSSWNEIRSEWDILVLVISLIKTVSRISIQQSLMTEIMKDLIDSQIINLITSVLSLMKSNSIRILKSLWWLEFSLSMLLNLKSQLNLSRFSIKQLNLSISQLNN